MRVRQGWSGEVKPNQWAKVSVELDEDDFRRLIREAGLLDFIQSVPLMTVYSLLELEAERLILIKLMVRHGYDHETGAKELAAMETAMFAVLDAIGSITVESVDLRMATE